MLGAALPSVSGVWGCRNERVRASALRQRGDGVPLAALEGVMLAVDKKFSMLGKVTRVVRHVQRPGTRPGRLSDD